MGTVLRRRIRVVSPVGGVLSRGIGIGYDAAGAAVRPACHPPPRGLASTSSFVNSDVPYSTYSVTAAAMPPSPSAAGPSILSIIPIPNTNLKSQAAAGDDISSGGMILDGPRGARMAPQISDCPSVGSARYLYGMISVGWREGVSVRREGYRYGGYGRGDDGLGGGGGICGRHCSNNDNNDPMGLFEFG